MPFEGVEEMGLLMAAAAGLRMDSWELMRSFLMGLAPFTPYLLLAFGLSFLSAKVKAIGRRKRRDQRREAKATQDQRPSLEAPASLSLREMTIADVDAITWRQFEFFVAALFRAQGMQATATSAENDWGADVVVEGPEGRIVVQCKHWRRAVGVKAVQEVSAARSFYHADRAIVVTNSNFTQQAVDLAVSCRVELWPRHRLAQELAAVKSALDHKRAS
jgi:hypothetical protein